MHIIYVLQYLFAWSPICSNKQTVSPDPTKSCGPYSPVPPSDGALSSNNNIDKYVSTFCVHSACAYMYMHTL